jgi:hypothetical protein
MLDNQLRQLESCFSPGQLPDNLNLMVEKAGADEPSSDTAGLQGLRGFSFFFLNVVFRKYVKLDV